MGGRLCRYRKCGLFRWFVMGLVLFILLSACGTSPNPPDKKNSAGCTNSATPVSSINSSNGSFLAGILTVGVVATAGKFIDMNQDQLLVQVGAEISNTILPQQNSPVKLQPLNDGLQNPITLRSTAVLFFAAVIGKKPADETSLLAAICIINTSSSVNNHVPITIDAASQSSFTESKQPALMVSRLSEDHQVVITGSSPDWRTNGWPLINDAAHGGDYGGGSPGGPPRVASGRAPACPTDSISSDSTVYVLDSVYPLDGRHHTNQTFSLTDLSVSSDAQPVVSPACDLFANIAQATQETDVPFNSRLEGIALSNNAFSIQHGLFSSALIHQIAPGAPISVIRVLNDHGEGDIHTLLHGLYLITRQQDTLENPSVIVNMSLTLQLTASCLENIWSYASGDRRTSVSRSDSLACTWRSLTPLGQFFHELTTDYGYQLVASAGNDSGGASQPLSADLPAAFCHITSVAAQSSASGSWRYDETNPLATFSNSPEPKNGRCLDIVSVSWENLSRVRSDHPGSAIAAGYTLFSLSDQIKAVVALGVDICSLFLHEGTEAPGDPAGLALWSGTSFAAAIVSGNLSRLDGSYLVAGTALTVSQPCTW